VGHYLHAVIGPRPVVASFASDWHYAVSIDLPQDFALVPISNALSDDIVELVSMRTPAVYYEFDRLTNALECVLLAVSKKGAVGYVEANYHGGTGFQKAIAWKDEQRIFGPAESSELWTANGMKITGAINGMLAAIGVWTRSPADEFDMLGLGKYRDTETVAERRR
jgi:hypothetical protein